MNIRCFLCIWFFGAGIASAHAELQLELTQGVSRATPVGIYVAAQSQAAQQVGQHLAEVISHDLQQSGRFTVQLQPQLTPTLWLSDHAADAAQQMAEFRQIDQDALLVLSVVQRKGQAKVTASFYDRFAERKAVGQALKLQVWQRHYTLKTAAERRLAHALSDRIYQHMLGVPGVFSTKIAYVAAQSPGVGPVAARYRLFVADVDGANARVLLTSAEPIMSPSWSPDGRRLAYVSFESGEAAIYIETLATGAREQVVSAPGINGAPAFSLDGRALYLVHSKTGVAKLYRLDLTTHQETALTHGPSIDTEPSLRPDGQVLAFTSNRGGSPQIYALSLVSGEVKRLTFQGRFNAHPSWTPDGKTLVFQHRDEQRRYGIARLEQSTGEMQSLSLGPADESPSVAPNGQAVVFATQEAHHSVLRIVSLDGLVKLRLPASAGDVREPAWSPNPH